MADIKLIGNDSGSPLYNLAQNVLVLEKFLASAGTINSIHLKCNAVGNAKVAIYTDSSGPNVRLASATSAVSVGNNIINISPILTSSTYYWLGVIGDVSGVVYRVYNASGNWPTKIKDPMAYSTYSFPATFDPSILSNLITLDLLESGWGSVTGGVGLVGDGLVSSEGMGVLIG